MVIKPNQLVILEFILIDHRYSDIMNVIKDEETRSNIVSHIVLSTLNDARDTYDYFELVNKHLQVYYDMYC